MNLRKIQNELDDVRKTIDDLVAQNADSPCASAMSHLREAVRLLSDGTRELDYKLLDLEAALAIRVQALEQRSEHPADGVIEDHLAKQIGFDCMAYELCDLDAHIAWRMGLEAWNAMKKYGAQFPHEAKQ